MVTDELVTLRRSVYARPGFVLAVTNTPALQDPVVRKDFACARDPPVVGARWEAVIHGRRDVHVDHRDGHRTTPRWPQPTGRSWSPGGWPGE